MRVGIVGTGFMGRVHAQAWARTDAELVGFCGRAGDKPPDFVARSGAAYLPDVDALLEESVDVVDVCAPTHLHHDIVLAAAAAGKHVLCEKPLARTVEQGVEMIAACREAGVRLLVGHVVRFFPEYAAAKAAVDRGAVGTPAVLRLGRSTFAPRLESDNWFTDEAKSGGLVLDLMVHDFDYARWVAGDVDTVIARNVAATRPEAGVHHCLTLLRHHGGALTHVEGSWAYPPPTFRTRFEIAGTAGVVDFDSERTAPVRPLLVTRDGGGETPFPSSPLATSPHDAEIRHFLDVLRGAAEPVVTAEDGLAALRIADAAAESVRTGAPVRIAPTEVDG